MSKSKQLLITGVSSGFGRALAQEALAAGHRAIAATGYRRRCSALMGEAGSAT
ncbi:hypothetical protein [Pseudoxanthomonas winnipegensis]|uniref:hypothetical protein n=1 Tax=Pseudoxanthomonas winnipegensis TaxID=2480810 RepID=UPI001F22A4F9|nr:hypothetical protein [Pseudoxanthomonas winnipegensis]